MVADSAAPPKTLPPHTIAMADRLEMWSLDRLIPYENNARTHSESQVRAIALSIVEFGWNAPILVDSDAGMIAGHGRRLAALYINDHQDDERFRGYTIDRVPVVLADHMSPMQRRAYIMADNKLAELAGWDEGLLAQEFADLELIAFDITTTGWTQEEVDAITAAAFGDGSDAGGAPEAGDTLALLDVTLAEPRHVVARGDAWRLGDHVLLCCSVFEDWPIWIPFLDRFDTPDDADTLFCPYPGPLTALSRRAERTRLVMVQPEVYIAGHLLDRYADVHGEDAVRRDGVLGPSPAGAPADAP